MPRLTLKDGKPIAAVDALVAGGPPIEIGRNEITKNNGISSDNGLKASAISRKQLLLELKPAGLSVTMVGNGRTMLKRSTGPLIQLTKGQPELVVDGDVLYAHSNGSASVGLSSGPRRALRGPGPVFSL
mgnify:CR=1 FL=1